MLEKYSGADNVVESFTLEMEGETESPKYYYNGNEISELLQIMF